MVLTWLELCPWFYLEDGFLPFLPILPFTRINPALTIGVSGAVFLVSWKKPSRAAIASLLLGIFVGLLSSEVRGAMDHVGDEFLALGLLLCFMGIPGAVLAPARSRVAWMLMLASGIGCFLNADAVIVFDGFGCIELRFVFLQQIPSSFFFILGSMFALMSLKEQPSGI
ncbi:hypothetical protein M1O57_00850 [Dehalococcoidia bacterium]|nr:hypothetical protein [Dehalococcoidia bacterium]MCL0038767.1 hypothetical protein [Dehalococcoidia bacterium]MCL0048792.1 hypothetical protein [Dehalococcoidia bacterium]MCL0064246.1 hypothetical protein [Dehalococcoidia bacterium]MCL0090584.1 hypothetical protein [Dehalococcoidia bacterium]